MTTPKGGIICEKLPRKLTLGGTVSAYGGSSKNLKDLKDAFRTCGALFAGEGGFRKKKLSQVLWDACSTGVSYS